MEKVVAIQALTEEEKTCILEEAEAQKQRGWGHVSFVFHDHQLAYVEQFDKSKFKK